MWTHSLWLITGAFRWCSRCCGSRRAGWGRPDRPGRENVAGHAGHRGGVPWPRIWRGGGGVGLRVRSEAGLGCTVPKLPAGIGLSSALLRVAGVPYPHSGRQGLPARNLRHGVDEKAAAGIVDMVGTTAATMGPRGPAPGRSEA